ncbi:MAG: hypothetical protein RI967_1000, partial [Planctomycetota bacterium]
MISAIRSSTARAERLRPAGLSRDRLASFLATFLAPVVATFLAACDGGSSSGTPSALPPSTDAAQGGAAVAALDKVSIQLNWVAEPEFGGFYAAEQKALFQSEGLEVTLVQGGPDVPAPQLVA